MSKFLKLVSSISLLSLLSLVGVSSVQAADVNPWQDCGIGAGIFPDNGTAAALSNIIWDSGTTAVTSATMSEESCSGERVKTAQFINDAYDSIEEDLVKGEGTHLTAMANLMSCSASQQDSIRGQLAEQLATETFVSSDNSVKAETLFFIAEKTCNA